MRTTIDIEVDVLEAAKELAERRGTTVGRVLSDLARRGLASTQGTVKRPGLTRGGVPVLPSRGEVVNLKQVRRLMDEEGV